MSGKRDRPAHFDIDQKTLQYKQGQGEKKQYEKDSEQKIKQRKFYKIKTPGENPPSSSENKPKFSLFTNNGPVSSKKDENPQQTKKQVENKQESGKLFGQKKESEKKQQQKKTPFSFSFPGFDDKKSQFGNGIGIFTNSSVSTFNKGEGIFSKNNIFSKSSSGDNKEQNVSKTTNSIFGTSQSVFSFNFGVPPVKKQASLFGTSKSNQAEGGGEDGEEGDSQQIQLAQKQVADPSKSTGRYEYKSECQTIFQKKALKTKKDSGDMIQNTEVIIQHDLEKKSYWVVVRLAATKNVIITGFLFKGKCQIKKLANKDQNVTLSVVTFKNKQPESHVLKIQFQSAQDGKNFKQTVQNIIQ